MVRIILIILLILFAREGITQSLLDRKVSIQFNEAKLEDLLLQLDEMLNIKISYSASFIPVEEIVSVSVTDGTLRQALDQALSHLPVAYSASGNRLILKFNDLRQTVRGTVRDIESQAPIFGATVTIAGTEPLLGTSTDENGKFRIERVPVGRRSVRVSYVGHEAIEVPNVVIGTGKETVLNLEIRESIVNMDEIMISSTGIGSPAINDLAVLSARSFSPEETKRFAASFGDPSRFVTAYPGVAISDDGRNEIIVRGNTPRGILWRVEGVEVPSPNHFSTEGAASGGISMLNTSVMDRSDFFTGAFPANYGNATSGVFDIHFRKGNNEKLEHTIKAGFLGLELGLEGPFKKSGQSSFLVNYRYSTLAILNQMGLIDIGDEESIFQDMSFKITIPTERFGRFSAFGLGGFSTTRENPTGRDDLETYDMGALGIKNELPLGSTAFLTTTVAISGTKIKDELTISVQGPDEIDLKANFAKSYLTAQSSVNWKFNARHTVESGLIYRKLRYDFRDNNTNTFNQEPFVQWSQFSDSGQSGSLQGFAAWKYRINQNLTLNSGMHTTYFEFTNETTLEPRLGLSWNFTPGKSISAAFGVHSRIESLQYYLGKFINQDGTTTQHNTDLQMTKARHFGVGYSHQVAPKTIVKLEGYYQKLFDLPVFVTPENNVFSTLIVVDGYTSVPLENSGTGKNYGVELSLERSFATGYYILTNGSIYESTYRARDGIERNTPFNVNFTNNFLAGKEWSVGKNGKNNVIGINAKYQWAGGRRYIPINLVQSINQDREVLNINQAYEAQFPNFFRFDIQLAYRKNKPNYTSEWRLDIQNLTDNNNYLEQFYNRDSRAIVTEQQLGLIPILSYKLEF